MDKIEKINAVQRMQDYIAAHLMSSISLYDLAKISGYSPWHCGRIFKELTGKNPFDYIRESRLSQAALKLRDEKVKIIEVAFDFVFDTPEGFSRAFSKYFGVKPSFYKRFKPPVKLFLPYHVKNKFSNILKGEKKMDKIRTIFVQVIDKPQRKLILKRGIKADNYFDYCEEVGCDVWGILCSIKDAIHEPMGLWLPDNLIKEGTSSYVQGVEVSFDDKGLVPDGFEIINLPACKMMIFQGQPYDDENFKEAIGELWDAIKNYDPSIYGFEWADEDAPRFQLEPQGYRGYIEGRPVRCLISDKYD